MAIILAFFMQHILFAQSSYHGLNVEKAKMLTQQARKKDREAAEILDSLRNLRWNYEELLGDAARTDLSKKERLQLEKDIADLKKEETNALKRRKEADDRLREVEEMLTMSPEKLNKKIVAIEKKEGKIDVVFPEISPADLPSPPKASEKTTKAAVASQASPTTKKKTAKKSKDKKEKKDPEPPINETESVLANKAQNDTPSPSNTENTTPTEGGKTDATVSQNMENQVTTETEKPKDKKKKAPTKSSKTSVQYAKYDPLSDPSVNPPKVPCVVTFEGQDAFTNRYKKELQSQKLFAHTEDFMRNALGNKEYITCKAQITEVQGGFRYLNLQFTIASRDAQRSFGFVDKGSPIVFKLMNGTNITLLNTKTDLGLINSENNTTTYNLSLLVNKGDGRFLQNNELDVLRVAWSAGYEDYDILWTDVLQNLFSCIEK